jgi:hypothetical protein
MKLIDVDETGSMILELAKEAGAQALSCALLFVAAELRPADLDAWYTALAAFSLSLEGFHNPNRQPSALAEYDQARREMMIRLLRVLDTLKDRMPR